MKSTIRIAALCLSVLAAGAACAQGTYPDRVIRDVNIQNVE